MKHRDTKKTATSCFNCGEYAVIWGNDFSFDDYGLDGKGIVHELYCTNCGAQIVYYCEENDDETNARA